MSRRLEYVVRPISDRSAFTGPPLMGNRNPFDAQWTSTLVLLGREIEELDGRHVVMEIDVREQDIRADGMLRANAIASTPAVRIAFDSMHGPLVYATDRYGWNYNDRPMAGGWQQNVRAIALGLEALRKVDRYGITKRAEQYRGFRAIGSGTGLEPTSMTTGTALEVIRRESGCSDDPAGRLLFAQNLRKAVRSAKAAAHPDRNNGDRARFDAVDQAVQVLERAGRL